jgi:hypothetical protein
MNSFKAGDLLHYKEPSGVKVLVLYIADHPRMMHAARVLFIRAGRTYSVNMMLLEVRDESG